MPERNKGLRKMLDNVIIGVSGKNVHSCGHRGTVFDLISWSLTLPASSWLPAQQNSQIRLKIHCQAWAEFFRRLWLRPKPLSEECVKSAKYCNYAHKCYFHQYVLAQYFETEHFMALLVKWTVLSSDRSNTDLTCQMMASPYHEFGLHPCDYEHPYSYIHPHFDPS